MIPLSYFTLILFLLINPSLSLSRSSSQFNPLQLSTMPGKRNLSSSSLSSDSNQLPLMGSFTRNKKLRRLPHVFSKVLELPFINSDADVEIEDRHDCLRFVANTDDGGGVILGDFRVHVVEVHPGVTKVVIKRRDQSRSQPLIDELELDVWRFRLPATTRPELSKAVYAAGQLVVTVPKNGWSENNSNKGDDLKKGFKGNMGNLVLVQ